MATTVLVSAGVRLNFQTPVASSLPSCSGRRSCSKAVSRSSRSRNPDIRDKMMNTLTTTTTVVLASGSATLPVGGTSVIAFARGPKRKLLRPASLSSLLPRFCSRSVSRSVIHCAADLEQQQQQQQQQRSSSSDSALESAQLRAATAAAAAGGAGAAAVVEVGPREEDEEKEHGGGDGGMESKENFVAKAKGFWEDLKEQHVIYRRDRDQWGLGFNPLFTVYEDAEGNLYRVDVNEKEILARCGIGGPGVKESQSQEQLLAGGEEEDSAEALAEKRIKMARDHARDIELGLVTPSPLSVLYKYERENKKSSSSSNGGSSSSVLPPWADSDARSSVAVMQFLTLLIALAAVAGLFTGIRRLLFWKKKEKEDPLFVKNRQLMQERKLKAQRNRDAQVAGEEREREASEEGNGSSSPPRQQQAEGTSNGMVSGSIMPGKKKAMARDEEGKVKDKARELPKAVFGEVLQAGGQQPPGGGLNDEEFRTKVAQIRAMARKARLQEQENAEDLSRSVEKKKLLLDPDQGQDQQEQQLFDEDDGEPEKEEGNSLGTTTEGLLEDPRFDNEEDLNDVAHFVRGPQSEQQEQQSNVSSTTESSPRAVNRKSDVVNARGGVKPRIILSVEEARARIAAKRIVRSSSASSSSPSSSGLEAGKSTLMSGAKSNVNFGKMKKPPPSSGSRSPSASSSATNTGNVGNAQTDFVESVNNPPSGSSSSSQQQQPWTMIARAAAEATASGSKEAEKDLGSNSPAGRPGLSDSASVGSSEVEVDDVTSRAEGSYGESAESDMRSRERLAPHEGEIGRRKRGIQGQKKSRDEAEEEMEWMRDDVLREIVFKVQANEEAGREPFHNLNSEQETLFFRGLERKFEREGDEVKKWIKDRVENIDYGSDGIGLFDPPEAYQMKWKDGADGKSMKSSFYEKFNEDRERIINEKRQAASSSSTSSPDLEATSSSSADENEELPFLSSSSSSSSPSSPSASSSSEAALPIPAPPASPMTPTTTVNESDITRGEPRPGTAPKESKTQTIISASPRAEKNRMSAAATGHTETDHSWPPVKENWDHTKRWAKDLERKYANETDPATRALMREIGQDLDRWITEDEIEDASRMLDKGVEGEEEYAKMHYERIKAKIQKQREQFGREAMLNKYSEYNNEGEEDIELWWLGLPYVVCVGLRATVEGEVQTGLYSVDVGGALEGVRSFPSVAYHTVAFQDRGDAQNFCTLVNSQPEKLGAEGADLVPFDPKDLYRDAKSEGYKVTVIKKGQLELSVDSPFEEVEHRIVELGSAMYFKEMMKDRVIDMNAVVEEGLGFGRKPQ